MALDNKKNGFEIYDELRLPHLNDKTQKMNPFPASLREEEAKQKPRRTNLEHGIEFKRGTAECKRALRSITSSS